MKPLKEKRKIVYAVSVIAIVLIVCAVIGVYSVITGDVVEKTTINNISEVATHDRNTITMFVEFNWKNLRRTGERLKRNSAELQNTSKVNEYLSYEASESNFDKIYLLMKDDSYYTDTTYHDKNTIDYYPYRELFTGESYKVIGLANPPNMVSENVIVYGYELRESLSGIKIGGDQKEVFAVIGISRRSSIVDGLVIESYVGDNDDALGYSSVVDVNGDYIVARNDIANFDSDNLFDIIDKSDRSDLTAAQVREKMQRGDTFLFYLKSGGVRELTYCIPINSDYIDWYFIMSVNDVALTTQTVSFVRMIVVAMIITVAVIVTAFVVIFVMQKRTQAALEQKKAQSEFLSNMSHEIRTPLNGLVGLNYLMMTAIDDPDKHKQVKEWLSKSHGTAKYLLSLINNVLDISKLRAGKVDVVNEPLIVESIVDSVYSMQCDNINNRGIHYVTDIDITVPCILSDETHIKQVLMNIISNAAKFTPAGGTIKLSVSQTVTDETHVVTTFTCEDTGCGMSKEFLDKIFDEFTQDRRSSSASVKGTGLGMAISKLLVNAMGGDITVESELGKGSKFTVTVPAEISDIPDYLKSNLDQAAEQIADESAADLKNMKILVAEDNELNAEILVEILGDSGFTAVHAENGEEAVKIFENSQVGEFGIILMDMRMPILDGCEASSRIRSLDRADAKTVPIIACTANTFQEDKLKAFDSGMNDFLTKPIDVKILLQKMDQICRDKNYK
ncbi:MAG: ATP-binding protein [Firmicutes bacterium]|nr:ATP-binding protein [Bacillota bacterium]